MKLIVNPHKIDLIKEEAVNEKEINISKCTFEFSDDYNTEDLVKEAYFTLDGETYKQIIVNNECSYPPEVLVKEGTVELGVVAYAVEDDEYIERFNPSPVYFQTQIGSLKDNAENSQEITPSELEQYEQALEEGLAEVQNVDIDASKTGNTATITITNRLGEEKTVQVNDGEKGEDGEPGITPNIQVGNTTTLPAGSNATVTQRGTTENPIFDFGIPKGQDGSGGGSSDYTPLSNKPKINNVELVGNKTTSDLGIVIPDISTKQDKITTTNKLSSDLVDDTDKTNKFVTASDKTTWSGKQDALVSGTNIKTINNESILGSGNVNISSGQTIQYDTVPTASADYVGKIIQYTGTTNSTYTNGYFYKCVNNGGTYSWENIEVQSSGGGAIQKSCEYLIRDNEVMVFIGRALGGLSTLDHLGIKSYLNTVLNDTNINGKSGITLSVRLIDAWFYTLDTIDLSTNGYKSIRVQTATETTLMSGTTSFGINRQNGVVDSNDWSKNLFSNLPSRYTTISGYNSSKTQTLKNVNGSIQWVDD